MTELQELLIQKSDQLDLTDVNLMLESLAHRKTQLEAVCLLCHFSDMTNCLLFLNFSKINRAVKQ